MGAYYKQRYTPGVQYSWSNRVYGTFAGGGSDKQISSMQRILTEEHPYRHQLAGKSDSGGPFDNLKVTVIHNGNSWTSRDTYDPVWNWRYDTTDWLTPSGDFLAFSERQGTCSTEARINSFLDGRVPVGLSNSQLNALGSKAISMVKPDNPSVDMATTLAELYAERKFFSTPGKGGSIEGEYLNYQFGIAPTVSTAQDLRKTIENRDPIIRQYQKDSGKLIRRKYRFDEERTEEVFTSNVPCSTMGNAGFNTYQNPGGVLTKTVITKRNMWFSGAFKYSIPSGSFPQELSELDRLYGVVPGVQTGWELVPFSWLVDYFTPIGGILNNMDSFLQHGLVIPFAYIMCTTEVDTDYVWRGPLKDSSGRFSETAVTGSLNYKRQQRIPASPFGFGLLPGDLNPKQLSILAALGISLRR